MSHTPNREAVIIGPYIIGPYSVQVTLSPGPRRALDLARYAAQHQTMRPLAHPVARRRRWWLPPRALAALGLTLLTVALLGGLWVLGGLPPDSENTVWVSVGPADGPDHREVGKGAKGVVGIAVVPGRVAAADLGPFAERVAALVAPTAPGLPALVVEAGHGVFSVVSSDQAGVHLAEPLVPRRVDTQAVQQALAADGFHWLILSLSVNERSQVTPHSAAEAGGCFGYNGLSCEWRIATVGPPLRFEVRPAAAAEGRA
jgi:hypothetical protein